MARPTIWMTPLLALAACEGPTTGNTDTSVGPSTPAIVPFPAAAYTGVDEQGGYTVPILATGGDGTFEFSVPSELVLSVAPGASPDLGVCTAVAGGIGNVEITSGDAVVYVPVTVTPYTAAQKTAGQGVFANNGCGGCHGPTGANPDITSSGLAEHTEAEILGAVQSGINPEDGSPIPIGGHSFTLTGDENPGIVAYLRSLAPAGAPAVDE